MALADTIKRAPRWAWISAAGIGTGAAALKVWKGRAKPAETPVAAEAEPAGGYGGPQPMNAANPSAVIVPPVIIGGNGADPNQGVGVLQDLYVGAIGGIMDGYSQIWGPVQTAQLALLTGNSETLQSLAQAGAAPQATTPMPSDVVAYTPPPPPAPVAIRPPARPAAPPKAPYKVVYENRTRDNGKKGAARRVWCNKVTIHRYPDGRAVVAGETRVKNGPC